MYEYEVLLKNGERTFIWAIIIKMLSIDIPSQRMKSNRFYFKSTLIDLPNGRSLFLSAGRARTLRPVFRVNRQFAQFSIRIFGEFDERNFPEIP